MSVRPLPFSHALFPRVTIVIPGEPAAKGRPRMTRAGQVYTPEKTRTREGVFATVAIDVMGDRPPFEGPLSMTVTAVFSIPKAFSNKSVEAALDGFTRPTKRPDADNVLKLVADSLNGIVFLDDAQIVEANVNKVWGRNPMTVVEVGPFQRTTS